MKFGTPDLPRNLRAVLETLRPFSRSLALQKLLAAELSELPGLLERWWEIASSEATKEQLEEFVRTVKEGGDDGCVSHEEVLERNPARKAEWEAAVRRVEQMTPEEKQKSYEESLRHKRDWEHQTEEWINWLEGLLADQKRYLAAVRAERANGKEPITFPM